MSPGNSATRWYLSSGASSSALSQCCAAAGAGQSGKQLHLNFSPTSFAHDFFFGGTLIPGFIILQGHQACLREAAAVFPR